MEMTLGQKIKKYRQELKMSQLDLENSIDASPGVISRIENGKVNPTKETLMKIGFRLELSFQEMSDLLGILPLWPAEDEIIKAREEVGDLLINQHIVGYLKDEWGRLHLIGSGFKDLFGLSNENILKLAGINILVIAMDHKLGIRKFMDEKYLFKTIALEILRIKKDAYDFENSEDFVRLKQAPGFINVVEEMNKITDWDLYDPEGKIVYFKVKGQGYKFYFTRENLRSNKRFEVVRYFNPQKY
jgi:transcriptional regulator with XRE-family HTH domain